MLLFASCLTALQARINGYLSFAYLKGQEQTDVSRGSFESGQAGLVFSGELAAGFEYLAEFNLSPEAGFEFDQALAVFKPSESFSLKAGLYRVPFGRYNSANRPHQTLLVKSPLNIETTFPLRWRDVGVLVEGRTRSFFYSVFLGNGLAEEESLSQGQQFKDRNRDKGKGGRFGLVLGQAFEVAYSHFRGKYDEGNARLLVLQAVDLAWALEGITIFSEYTRARLDLPDGQGHAEGFYVMASFEMDRLRPVASFQRIKYEDGFHGPGFLSPDAAGEGISENLKRWTVGFVYSLAENLLLKFEYDFNREKDIEIKNNSFSIQAALSF